jgi:hypothetical protein
LGGFCGGTEQPGNGDEFAADVGRADEIAMIAFWGNKTGKTDES